VPPPPIRVLVVDDSVVIRRLVTGVLEGDPDIEVVGTAVDGAAALRALDRLKPDLVTLDVEMPVMDGLATLKELRKVAPRLPVIMFSTLTERGASTTLDALSHGASDYVTKPSNVGSMEAGMAAVHDQLVPKIKALVSRPGIPDPHHGEPTGPTTTKPSLGTLGHLPPPGDLPEAGLERVELVAIGVSTGGPNALEATIPLLPADFPVPIVIVQHMPPMFTGLLAERLDAKSHLQVLEGTEGLELVPGRVVIAPGGLHMEVTRPRPGALAVTLNEKPPENSCRPAVDVMFRSVASVLRARSLGLVMTGMGRDGFEGARCLRSAGAAVLAQDEATSVVWGMPGFVARGGLATDVLPLDQIPAALQRRVGPRR
jgi:two-component system chemotaxis response regulator CheB